MYIDFHSHVLPCADHGSESVEMSLSQLSAAKRANVSTIVATPHFYLDSDDIPSFLERRERSYNELAARGLGGIEIIKAAEVHIVAGIENLEGLEKLCIGNTNYILLELPSEPWSEWMLDAVRHVLVERRLRPICAHIDRYSHIARDKMLQLNVDVQINADAFTETRKRRAYYTDLVADDSVHVLGSDTHGDGKYSYKTYTAAIKKLGSFAEPMMQNARRILASGQNK